MLNRTEQKLLDALEPQAAKNGIEIVTIEIIGSKKSPTVRIYIDTAREAQDSEAETNAKNSTISFDELASSQAWISALLDEIDPFAGSYTLEVSSPGIDRPLRTAEHFNAHAGEEATIKLKGRINNKSTLRGEIVSATAGNSDEGLAASVTLRTDNEDITIPLTEIKRANLKGKVEFR